METSRVAASPHYKRANRERTGWLLTGRLTKCVFWTATAGALLTGAMGATESQPDSTPSKPKPDVGVVGLQIRKPTAVDKDEEWKLRDFDMDPGIKVILQTELASGGLLKLDAEKSRVRVFKDDTGRDLGAAKALKGQGAWGPSCQVSKDSKALLCLLEGYKPPAEQATMIHLAGSLSLRIASEKDKAKSQVTALEKGTIVKVGPYRLSIKEVGKDFFSKKPSITFESKKNLEGLIQIRLRNEKGKLIKTEQGVTGRFSLNQNKSWTQSITLDKTAKKAAVEIEYWTNMTSMAVPFDLNVKLGLGN